MARRFLDRSPQRGIPSVSLRRLLADARFPGTDDWQVSGVTADLQRIEQGQVYVAVRDASTDGHADVAVALERGAAGVVVERPCPEAGDRQILVNDSRAALARIAHAIAGNPSEHLRLIGVAGRSRKTLTGLFLRSILEAGGRRFGRIGSTSWSDGHTNHPIGPGSPEPEGLAWMLAGMVRQGCDGAILEMNADALERRAVEGLELEAAVITHLSGPDDPAFDRDAIFGSRRQSARLLKRIVPGGAAVLDADDPFADPLGAVNLAARRITFGLDGTAEVSAIVDHLDPSGARFRLVGFDRETPVRLQFPGVEHLKAALAASALAWSLGIDGDEVAAGLESVERIPGRLERVSEPGKVDVRIDQSRTPGELRQALNTLRSLKPARIFCILGSEGSRDRGERLALAQVAESCSDQVILTADNPRTEPLAQIFEDLLAGFRRPGKVRVEPDRRHAIESALAQSTPDDIVLIAGKGRHSYQILADRVLPFDDAEVVSDWFQTRLATFRRTSA